MLSRLELSSISLFICLFMSIPLTHAQYWEELRQDPSVSFYDVQSSFEAECKSGNEQTLKSSKRFGRYQDYMETRVDEKGFYDPAKTWTDYLAWQKSQAQSQSNPKEFWQLLGPLRTPLPENYNNQGIGRIKTIAFHPTNPDTYWVGSPTGGIWKTENNGEHWSTVSDFWDGLEIGSLTVDPNNPNIIFSSIISSNSILRSVDGGDSFVPFGTNNPAKVSNILIDPDNSDKMLLTSLATTNRGVYYSLDGGNTWTMSNLDGSVREVVYHPTNSDIVYAAKTGQLYKSIDGGISFSLLSTPFNTTNSSLLSIAVSANAPDHIYVAALNYESYVSNLRAIYRSTDNGNTFDVLTEGTNSNVTYVNGTNYFYDKLNRALTPATGVWLTLAVNPLDENEIYVGGISLARTTDGGNNWTIVSASSGGGGSVHTDFWDLSFHPITNEFYASCDGGVYRNAGAPGYWDRLNDFLAVTQAYRLGQSETNPDLILLGTQDNGVIEYQWGRKNWIYKRIGDGMQCLIDPVDDRKMYSSIQRGDVRRSIDKGATWINTISPETTGQNAAWTVPFVMDPTERRVLYVGFQDVWKSTDFGVSWTNSSNGTLGNGTSVLRHIEVAPSDNMYIYAGSYNDLSRSTDGGTTWSPINTPNSSFIKDITIHSQDPEILYVAQNNGKVYVSRNGGASWTDFSEGLPPIHINTIVFHDHNYEELYLGMDIGVYYKKVSSDWTSYNTSLPNVQVMDLKISHCNGKLRAATYGRGLWETDLRNTYSYCCQPAFPIISPAGPIEICESAQSDHRLTSSVAPAGYSYQWYKDDVIIANETSQYLTIEETGIYEVKFIGECNSYKSEPVNLSFACALDACSDFNISTNLGPGNRTIVNVLGPFAAFDPLASEVNICVTTEGDVGSPIEIFNVYDEDENLVGQTNYEADCDGPTPRFCFNVTISAYTNWIADDTLTVSFDPINTSILLSNYCDINQACVSVKVPVEPAACLVDDYLEKTIASGYYSVSRTIESDGVINSKVTFDAGHCIELKQNFTVSTGAEFLAKIEGCGSSTVGPDQRTGARTDKLPQIAQEKIDQLKLTQGVINLIENLPLLTVLEFELAKASHVNITLIDQHEKIVLDLFNSHISAGKQEFVVDLSIVDSGRYNLVMETESCKVVKAVLVDKKAALISDSED